MAAPTPFLPFFTSNEEACLAPGGAARVVSVATPAAFVALLQSGGQFAATVHRGRGDRDLHEQQWVSDGKLQYEGWVRKVRFLSPISAAPIDIEELLVWNGHSEGGEETQEQLVVEKQENCLSQDPEVDASSATNTKSVCTRVEEEQHYCTGRGSRKDSEAWLEVRRLLPDLKDGHKFSVVARWSISFDGFAASIKLLCGVHFRSSSSVADHITEGCRRAYMLNFSSWCKLAERFARRVGIANLASDMSGDSTSETSSTASSIEGTPKSGRIGRLRIFVTSDVEHVIVGDQEGEILLVERNWDRSSSSLVDADDSAGLVDDPGGLPQQHWKRIADRLSRWANASSEVKSLKEDEQAEDEDAVRQGWQARLLMLGKASIERGEMQKLHSQRRESTSGTVATEDTGVKVAMEQTRYSVTFQRPRLGIQLRDLHGIPVIAGMRGYEFSAQSNSDDEEDAEDEMIQWSEADGAALLPRGPSSLDLHTKLGAVTDTTSSYMDSGTADFYNLDLTIKCIVECPGTFGLGVKKLWRWKPSCDREELGTTTGMRLFMRGLLRRVGRTIESLPPGQDILDQMEESYRVSFFDSEEEEYLSLDAESWPEFVFLQSKRLLVEDGEADHVTGSSQGADPLEKNELQTERDQCDKNVSLVPSSSAPDDIDGTVANLGAGECGSKEVQDAGDSLGAKMKVLRDRLWHGDDMAVKPEQPSTEPTESRRQDEPSHHTQSTESEESSLPNDGDGAPPRAPCVGSVLLAVNGVRTQGLSFSNVVDLLQMQQRPIEVEFEDSWDRIFHSHVIETEFREKISRETFDQKMNHPLASKLRKHISDWLEAFQEQDLATLCTKYDAESRDPGAAHVMLWSLIRWVEQQLRDLGVFSNNHRAGGGLPIMGELQWTDVKHHLERHIFERVFDQCLTAAPEYGEGDAATAYRLASLRFLQPRHWCVDSLSDRTNDGGGHGREWELAQRELCRLVEYRCPRDMIDCVRACVRLVALSVEASMARRGQCVNFGADDLLAALTWIVVQANPPRLASRMWFMSYYLRTDDRQSMGEGGYCLTQLASAVEFAKECDASVLADITEEDFERGLNMHTNIQSLIEAAAEGREEAARECLAQAADPNGLSTDQQNTALTCAIFGGHMGIVKLLLSQPSIDPNIRVCPNYGPRRSQTPLMLAAERGDLVAVLLLLRQVKIARSLVCSDGYTAVQYAAHAGHDVVASVLEADPSQIGLVQAVAAGSIRYVRALLLQGCDPNSSDSAGQLTPLMLATLMGDMVVMQELLNEGVIPESSMQRPRVDVNRRNVRGESPLMYCVQREGFATPQSQVDAAVLLLKNGADRNARDSEGRTALDWARRFGSVRLADIIEYDPQLVAVYKAAKDRNVRAVLALLTQGVDPNMRCPERGYTALVAAVFNQDLDMARALLSDARTDVNCPAGRGMTPLMYAANAGHEPMVLLLLRRGADRYCVNDLGESAFQLAKLQGRVDLANILQYDPMRMSICVAASAGDWSKVAALARQGISINSRHRQRTFSGWHHEHYTPLIAACSRGHLRLAAWLLEQGADVDRPNMYGQTPLMYATARGYEDTVLLLLKARAARQATDVHGRSASWWAVQGCRQDLLPILRVDPAECTIHAAVAAGSMENVTALTRQGISASENSLVDLGSLFSSPLVRDVSQVSAKANLFRSSFEPARVLLTPLTTAAIFGRNQVVRGLVDNDSFHVNVDGRDGMGRTALMYAARYGNTSTVLLLLQEGAQRYKHDRNRLTATAHAIQVGEIEIAGIINADPNRVSLHDICAEGKLILTLGMLRQGIDVNTIARGNRYCTPLMAAAANKQKRVVAILLKQPGIKLDVRNSRGETALMHSARAGALDVSDMLISAGARVDLIDNKGMTAEHHAYKAGHASMVLFKALCVLKGGGDRKPETQILKVEEV